MLLDARREEWGVHMAGSWVEAEGDTAIGVVSAPTSFQNGTTELAVSFAQGPNVEMFFGGRYQYLSLSVRPVGGMTAIDAKQWGEPFVGLRAVVDAADWLRLGVRGDVGGFGAGGSDLTWNLLAGAGLWLGDSTTLDLGYRVMSSDFDRDGFRWDGRQSGLLLGATFYW